MQPGYYEQNRERWVQYRENRRRKLAAETPEEREERLAERRRKRHGRAERVRHSRTPEEKKALGLERAHAYYRAHRTERLAYLKARREADPEASRAYEREVYRRRQPMAQASNRARARRMGNPSRDTIAYDQILRGDPCCFCGAVGVQVDHIVPVATDGANHWTNLTAACQPCNRAKSDKPLLGFLSTMGTR